MLLADTSVWSLALRRRSGSPLTEAEERLRDGLAETIQSGLVAMIGPIRQELLSGIKDTAQFERIKVALEAFRDEAIDRADYEEAARLYNLCRAKGLQCGPVDILIIAVARRRKWRISTNDAAMTRCLEALTLEAG